MRPQPFILEPSVRLANSAVPYYSVFPHLSYLIDRVLRPVVDCLHWR